MLSRFSSSNDLGATTTTTPVALPPNATRDSLWGNTEVFNGLANVFPRFRIDGLAPSWRHTVRFFASRTGVSDSRQTRYTVTGAGSASVDLEVANNTAATAVLSNVASSQAGTLEVALSPGPLNNNSYRFTYLGSLQIDAKPGPAPPRAMLAATVTGNGSIVASPAQADHAVGEFVHLTADPAPGWVFAGWSGDASGAANPLVVVIDSDPAINATFVAQNTAPAIGAIADRLIYENTSTGAIAITIGDVETPASLLVINKYSSNPAVVAPSGLVLGGSEANRTIFVTPLPNAYGTTTITVSVTDGELTSESNFLVTVVPINEAPPFHAWLAGFGLTAEPSDDSDGGGLNNLTEFLFAYDPTDPSDDLLFRLELVIGHGNVEVAYPELMPVGDYHLSKAADPSQLADPINRVETITKAQIVAMSQAERSSRTYTTAQGVGPVFFRLEFEPSPLE
jgi:uncharacterized repeat protein (TIGR02543 family)